MSNDEFVEKILKDRYYLPGESSWDDIAKRVSMAIGDNTKQRMQFFDMIQKREFIPNSPCLFNAGTSNPLMSACFAIGIDDSMESIFNAVKMGAQLMKAGAGVGYDFSTIRPIGAPVGSTSGIASGVISFMKNFDVMIEVVKQAGRRRGAAIGILRIDHPEIREFISCKDEEGKFSNFNISVMITDDFITAVKNNETFDLKFNGKIYETVNARELFHSLAMHTHKTGEPGYLFYDHINDANPNKHLGDITATNPCVTGDTLILTSTGYIPIVDLVGKQVDVWNGFEWSSVTPALTGTDQEIYEVTFSNGARLRCTEYHRFPCIDGEKQLSQCEIGDKLIKYELPVIEGVRDLDYAYENGFYAGDGHSDRSHFIAITNIQKLNAREDVYCMTEEKRHQFIANGILTMNCGEIPIFVDPKTNGGESCNLGSIDVSKFLAPNKTIDYQRLRECVQLGVRFLNNVMDKNAYPFQSIADLTLQTRKIGLGIMGFADLLIKQGISYGSKESVSVALSLMEFINTTAIEESMKIAAESGHSYPAWEGSDWQKRGIEIANSVVTCQAPTGSISIFANCSSGIEPNFSYVYNRSTWSSGEKRTTTLRHPLFDTHLQTLYEPDEIDQITQWVFNHGSLAGCPVASAETKRLFITAKDLSLTQHIDIQAAFQKHVGNSISKTCNCPSHTTVEEVEGAIMYAWESGLKGLTIYREGSRNDVVLSVNTEIKNNGTIDNPVVTKILNGNGRILPKTPRDMFGMVAKRNSGCGKLYVVVGEAFDNPHTIVLKNKGGCSAMTQALGELTALALRWGIPKWDLTKILCGIRCDVAKHNKNSDGASCAAILGDILRDAFPEEEMPSKHEGNQTPPAPRIVSQNKCPECKRELTRSDGCITCQYCGWSKCL